MVGSLRLVGLSTSSASRSPAGLPPRRRNDGWLRADWRQKDADGDISGTGSCAVVTLGWDAEGVNMMMLAPATSDNWRDIARVRAAEHQRRWVADVTYYLCLSAYGGLWRSCAVLDERDATVGHVMWAVDPDDDSHWIGGLVIDTDPQAKGLGRAAVESLMAMW